jgi:hypothetical protein
MAATDKINGTDGEVLFGSAVNITGASGTTTITVTASGHGLSAGDRIKIANVGGMTDLNGIHTVATASTTFTVVLSTATSQTYTTGGTVQKYMDMTKWDVEQTCGTQDVTDSGSSGWREKIPNGFADLKGSFEGFIVTGANFPTKGSSLTIRLNADSDTYWSGTGFITREGDSVSVGADNAVVMSLDFEGTGSWTVSNS